MKDVILGCLTCGHAFLATEYDTYPTYEFNHALKNFDEIKSDDMTDFLMNHRDHKVVQLKILNSSFYSNFPYCEPIREDYIIATDGNNDYLIKQWREDINEPLRYQIIDAKIEVTGPIFQVQERELRKQMLFDSDELMMDERDIDEFVKKFEVFASEITLDDFQELIGSAEEPMTSYGVLKEESLIEFLTEFYSCPSNERFYKIINFARKNSEYSDVMNLIVRWTFKLDGKDVSQYYGFKAFPSNN